MRGSRDAGGLAAGRGTGRFGAGLRAAAFFLGAGIGAALARCFTLISLFFGLGAVFLDFGFATVWSS
jgi:hypothetical protein